MSKGDFVYFSKIFLGIAQPWYKTFFSWTCWGYKTS